ncbi:cytochrome P450 [Gilbertella persicaria]|uniref:cytochrome P450 n=1 Tax=Gilbertella persicaria TaxID=101096 RepID=UPI0022208C2B|nr:cytochrome P450 [Gilbertella persicaria]KAI8088098.1 cytochrome P450 [Gilbertella persicaria]
MSSFDNRTLQVAAALTLKYNDRPFFYEHPEGIPYKGGIPAFGNLFDILSNVHRFHDFQIDLFEKSDSLTMTAPAAGNPTAVMTIDPQNIEYVLKGNFKNYLKGPKFKSSLSEILGNGIFNANGEQWRYQRKAASHIFNVKNFRDEFTDVFVKEMRVLNDNLLQPAAQQGTIIDFHDLIFKFTLDSFVYLGFGIQLDSLLNTEKIPFAVSFDHLQRLGALRFASPFAPINEAFTKYITPWKMSTTNHVEVIDTFAETVIRQRRKEVAEGIEHKDLLSRFMNTTNEKGEKLNDVELRDTILNFIIAGRDTTAQALSWLFYNLALQPRIEKKMMEEIKDKITEDTESDSPALYEVINTMPYIHAVFYETLRLHPPVPANQKYALEDDIWPDGTIIKAGYYVNWSTYAQARNTKIWGDNAREFYPERWIDEQGSLRRENAGKWPAFHAGPRICLGQNLATLEALVCIIFLLRRYSFKLVPGQEITYDISLTLPMKNGMKMFVEKRNK